MTALDEAPDAPRRRVSPRLIALIFAVIFAVLAAGYYFLVQPSYVEAFTGIRPADTAALVTQLDAKAIPYRLSGGGSAIAVPAAQVDAARVAIAGSDVPLHGGVGLELFNKSDMGLTDFAQKINYQRALQGELERTIMMIDGIESARVHLAIPDRSIFRAERTPAKAAVELLTKPGAVIYADRIAGVQRLVANAVADLAPSDVVILDSTGRALSSAENAETTADPVGERQQALQHYYRARVRVALATALPGVRADVRMLVLSHGGAEDGATAGPTGNRDFGLCATVMSAAPLTAEQQAQARTAAAEVIGFDAALGDTIDFVVGLPDTGTPASTTPGFVATASAAPGGAARAEASVPGSWWLWLSMLGLAAIAGWQCYRRVAERRQQRHDLVSRLHAALADSEGDYAR